MTGIIACETNNCSTNEMGLVMFYTVTNTSFSAKTRKELGNGTSQETLGYCWHAEGY